MAYPRDHVVYYRGIIDKNTTIGVGSSSTSNTVDMHSSSGTISLFLENSGTSTSLTVTYQIGFIRDNETTINWITPEDGGDIINMTTINIAGSSKHEHLPLLAPTKYYRFIVTNNDLSETAIVTLTSAFVH